MSKAEEFVFVSGTQPVSTSENFTELECKKIEIFSRFSCKLAWSSTSKPHAAVLGI